MTQSMEILPMISVEDNVAWACVGRNLLNYSIKLPNKRPNYQVLQNGEGTFNAFKLVEVQSKFTWNWKSYRFILI